MENKSKQKRKSSDPFYVPPKDRDTASDIINEARSSLKVGTSKRPFTPKDTQRTFFGVNPVASTSGLPSGSNSSYSRPPSSFSLNSKHFVDPVDSRPPSGTKLAPLEHKNVPPLAPLAPTAPPKGKPPNRKGSGFSGVTARTRNLLRTTSAESLREPESSRVSQDAGNVTEKRSDSAPKEREPPKNTLGATDSGYITPESRTNSGGSSSGSTVKAKTPSAPVTPDGSKDVSVARASSTVDSSEEFITPLLQSLSKDGCPSKMLKVLVKIDDYLENNDLYRQKSNQRSAILKSAFKLLDIENAELQVKLTDIILKYRVSGNNLNNVCKLVFKLAKSETNDELFAQSKILDSLMDVILATDEQFLDVLVYVFGALKFLCSNSKLLDILVQLGLVPTIANFFGRIPSFDAAKITNSVIQATACVRNIAEDQSNCAILLRYKVLQQLLTVAEIFISRAEIVLNVCRTFSRVVVIKECCEAILKCKDSHKVLKSVLRKHYKLPSVTVRLLFFIGTASVSTEDAENQRVSLYNELSSHLMLVYTHYLQESENSNSGQNEENDDVLVKFTHSVANLSLSEEVSLHLAESEEFLDFTLQLLASKPVLAHNELVLNMLFALNNISYFSSMQPNGPSSALVKKEVKITNILVSVMMPKELDSIDDNLDAMLGVVMVYGNLSKSSTVRKFISENQIDLLLFALLECGRRELLYNIVGVLINLSVDSEECRRIQENGVLMKLIGVLRDFGQDDWELAANVCKTLMNYCSLCPNKEPFSDMELSLLSDLLHQLLDEASEVLEIEKPNLAAIPDNEHVTVFHKVAGSLLNRVNSFLEF